MSPTAWAWGTGCVSPDEARIQDAPEHPRRLGFMGLHLGRVPGVPQDGVDMGGE
jgi:hypothetical protein